VKRLFYPAGKLPAVPGWLGRCVEHTASPGRFREEQNQIESAAYFGNRPASNLVAVPTELSRFCLIEMPAIRRVSGDVTDRYHKMCKSCANVGLSLQLRSFVTAEAIANSCTSHQTDLKSLQFRYTRG